MANIELLDRVIAHIEANPQSHDQSSWFRETECGTTACLAGHAILLAHPGAAPVWHRFIPNCRTWTFSETTVYVQLAPGGEELVVPTLARELLGLKNIQADMLFNAESLSQIKVLRDVLATNPDAGKREFRGALAAHRRHAQHDPQHDPHHDAS